MIRLSAGEIDFSPSEAPRPPLDQTKPHTRRVAEHFSPELKRPGPEAYLPYSSIAKVNSA